MDKQKLLKYLEALGHKAYLKDNQLYSSSGTPISVSIDGSTGKPKFSTKTTRGLVYFTNNGKFNSTGDHDTPDMRTPVQKGADWFMKNIGSPIHEAIDAYKGSNRSVLQNKRTTTDKIEDAVVAFMKPYGKAVGTIVKPVVSSLAEGAANDPEAAAAQYMAGQTPTVLTQKQTRQVGEKIGEAAKTFTEEAVPYMIPYANYAYMAARGEQDRKDGNYLGMVLNWTGPVGKIIGSAGKAALNTNTGRNIALKALMDYNIATTNLPQTLPTATSRITSNMNRAKRVIASSTQAQLRKQHSISGTVNSKKLRETQKEVTQQYKAPKIQESLNFNYSTPLTSTDFRTHQEPGIQLFDRPYTTREIKQSLKNKYNIEKFSDADLTKSSLAGISIDNNGKFVGDVYTSERMMSVDEMERLAKQAGSQDPKIYGIINDDGGDYSGFIMGNTKVSVNDPSVQLMLQQIEALPSTLKLPKQLSDSWSQQVKNEMKNSKPIYYYFSNKDTYVKGYHNPQDNSNFINIRDYNITPEKIKSSAVHEGVSHQTDPIFEWTPIDGEYTKILENLDVFNFKYDSSAHWYELRATMNELKNKYAPDGNLETLKRVLKSKSDGDLIQDLSEVNGYGLDYADALAKAIKTGNYKSARGFLDSFRKGMIVLPAALPFTIVKNKYGGRIISKGKRILYYN